MRHTRVRLLFLWERAGEDAFKNGVFDFFRVGGGADFADAVGPPLPLIRPSSLEKDFVVPGPVKGRRVVK